MPPAHLRELEDLVHRYLQPARDRFGRCTVVSGHRSAEHNRRVGGASQSRHLHLPGMMGAAADVQFERGSPREWADFFERMRNPPGGLGVYSSWVHVDTRPGRARWSG